MREDVEPAAFYQPIFCLEWVIYIICFMLAWSSSKEFCVKYLKAIKYMGKGWSWDLHHSCGTKCFLPFFRLPPRSAKFLLPPAAGLLHSLLHLHPASVPGSEEGRTHAHSPQSAHHSTGITGLLGSLQLHPSGQVDPVESVGSSIEILARPVSNCFSLWLWAESSTKSSVSSSVLYQFD